MKNKYKVVLGLLLIVIGGLVLGTHIVGNAKKEEAKATIKSIENGKAFISYEVDEKSYLVEESNFSGKEGDEISVYYSKSDPKLVKFDRYNYMIIICSSVILLCGLVVLFIKEKE